MLHLFYIYVLFIGNVQNEVTFAESMEKLGSVALSREAETGIGDS